MRNPAGLSGSEYLRWCRSGERALRVGGSHAAGYSIRCATSEVPVLNVVMLAGHLPLDMLLAPAGMSARPRS